MGTQKKPRSGGNPAGRWLCDLGTAIETSSFNMGNEFSFVSTTETTIGLGKWGMMTMPETIVEPNQKWVSISFFESASVAMTKKSITH